MRQLHRLFLTGLLLAPGALFAQQPEPGRVIPLDPAVRTGRLENGLSFFIRANARPEKRAELRLVVNAGSILEDSTQRGLAHVVEHMAFNGTAHFQKQALVDYLESIGMRFGADLNAYTGFDETMYLLTVPTDTGTALERGIQILEDWAHEVTFDPVEIDKERGVVTEEWRLGQGAGARLRDQVFPVLFRGSRYADRLPIGTPESLRSFHRDELVRFYKDWYRPDLMAVVAVGDFDAAEVERLIRQQFSSVRGPANPRQRPSWPIEDHDETLVVVATDPEATSTSVNVYYKHDPKENATYGAYRQSLLANLYSGILNSRLSELARNADPPFVNAGAGDGSLVRTQSAFSIGAGVRDGQVLRGLDAVLTEASRVSRFGFTASELEREKRDLLRYYETNYAERDKTESSQLADEYARHFLENEAVPGIAVEFDLAKTYLPGITLDEVNALSAEWLTDRNRVVVVQAPRKEGVAVPTRQEILGVFGQVEQKSITAYEDVVAATELVASPPQPGQVTSERTFASAGVTEWRLSNGVRVLLKPTDFKDDEVLMSAVSPGGLSLVPDADYVSGQFASTLVQLSGYGDFDITQLQKFLAGKAVSIQPSLDDRTEGLSGGASPKDLETLLQLTWLAFSAPREDSVAFRSVMTRFRGILENQQASPDKAFSDTLTVTMAQHHPRAVPVTLATLDRIDRDRAFDIFRDRFADASDFTFVFAGNIDLATMRPLVERWLASLPATRRTETWRDTGIRPPTGVVTKVVRKGIEPKSQTAIVFSGPFEYSRENVQALTTLTDVLEIRLRDVLREELGGTYGVQIGQSATRDPWSQYSVTISFGAAPERLDSLASVVFEEIERVKANGPDAATLQKVKETQRREHETSLRRNGYWVSRLVSATLQGIEPDQLADVPALIDGVTSGSVADAAKRWLLADRYVRVSLMPER
jgi:zinc protease